VIVGDSFIGFGISSQLARCATKNRPSLRRSSCRMHGKSQEVTPSLTSFGAWRHKVYWELRRGIHNISFHFFDGVIGGYQEEEKEEEAQCRFLISKKRRSKKHEGHPK